MRLRATTKASRELNLARGCGDGDIRHRQQCHDTLQSKGKLLLSNASCRCFSCSTNIMVLLLRILHSTLSPCAIMAQGRRRTDTKGNVVTTISRNGAFICSHSLRDRARPSIAAVLVTLPKALPVQSTPSSRAEVQVIRQIWNIMIGSPWSISILYIAFSHP
ncbi:uncharacterized protein B0T23DRAFT_69015 [Neurospora hispaniola]|uniref:Uncharacterized protein n=1 Tax=Neurospora hispaniola TaxID=588809 RepID=A0AAJ0MTE0_9PEZI|nr:hypothetical protein B0T23DRAFT_69015 [Neurospora hispaniola]